MTVAVSLFAWRSPAFLHRLIFDPFMVKKGQIDRFITYGFIHAPATAGDKPNLHSTGKKDHRHYPDNNE